MERYEVWPWMSSNRGNWVIRDTLEEVYIRDSEGNVCTWMFKEQTERCERMNELVRQREKARARFIAWNGDDTGFDDAEAYEAQGDPYEGAYEREWLDYCDAMGYDPNEYLDADAYSNLITVRDSYL